MKIIDRAPAPPPDTVVWRGLAGKFTFTPGEDVQLKGMISTSLDPDYARKVSPGSNTTLEILNPRGAYVGLLGGKTNAKEYLLPHGKTYRVLGPKQVTYADGSKGTVIQMRMH